MENTKQKEDADMKYNVTVTVTEQENRTLTARVRNHKIVIDQPKEFGADDKGATPPELLAVSFGSCIVSTLQLIAIQKELDIRDISVVIDGCIDFSRAMGISDRNRAGFPSLTATISFTSSLDEAAKKRLISEVAKIGAALDNIENATQVEYILK